jgi:Kae1-associated kinase Bud32
MMAARKAGVSVPIIYDVRIKDKEIVMQYLYGERIKDVIDSKNEQWQRKICREIGRSIANLHKNGIIHGDITTSNMIWMHKKLYFIDFGLGMKSTENEDRGVDLHLLMEAFKAAHKNKNLFQWVLETYEENFDEAKEVIKKVEEIARRGRYMRKVT